MTAKKPENQLAQLTEDQLDDVSGGSLPKMQKVRETEAPTNVNVLMADGSVRFVTGGTSD